MQKTFNFYCDESCHLENDQKPYMLISYVSTAYNQIKLHTDNIKRIKEKHNFKNEIKWSSVSKGKFHFYMDLIDYFFSNDLNFRAIVVDKEKIKNFHFDQSYDKFIYKMYYQLMFHKINMEYNYNIYLDIKDSKSSKRVQKLKELLNLNYSTIRSIQNIRSEESLLLQLTDLIMGALSYHLRRLDETNNVIAKKKIIEKIQQHTNITLDRSTAKSNTKFNLFFIDLK